MNSTVTGTAAERTGLSTASLPATMLGLQETRQAGTSSTKSYSCVACSATFQGLASLLVHQASHASELSSPPGVTSPVCTHCGGLFASEELLDKHQCMVLPLPATQGLSHNGEGFWETGAAHEQSAIHETKMYTESGHNSVIKSEVMTDSVFCPPSERLSSHATAEAVHQTARTVSEAENIDCMSAFNVATMQRPIATHPSSPMSSTEAHSESFKNESISIDNEDSSEGEESPDRQTIHNKNESLLKILAKSYMNHRTPEQSQWTQNKRALPPRKVSPRAPIQVPLDMSPLSPECADNRLRQGVTKCAPNQEERTFSPKNCPVTMTKPLYPVVALETRQKLCADNAEGRFQCGICRRVFQTKDTLIMHHVMHRKDRVKFCRNCQEFFVSVISVPDNHTCSGRSGGDVSLLTLVFPRRLFSCRLCKRSYTRRHRLKTHKCKVAGTRNDDAIRNHVEGSNLSLKNSVSVAVNTTSMKSEDCDDAPKSLKFHLRRDTFESKTSPKRFSPFLFSEAKFAKELSETDNSRNFSFPGAEGRPGSNPKANESLEGGQWTVPLDDAEVDVLTDEESCSNLDLSPSENSDDEVIILEPSGDCATTNSTHLISRDFQVHVSDSGIRRFSCNKCKKSYSRRFTLNQHLSICRSRKVTEPNSFGKVSANILGAKKKFPCPHCGSAFTRKDNMNMHRKRCQSMRHANNTLQGNRMSDKRSQATQGNMFVLPPVSKSQVRPEGSSSAASGNWGIMSLPSVLPRKVTCECSASFTCPRLLFEHLQMHALESYICSQCGENLQSWAEFEAHQQLHQTFSRPKVDDKGPHVQQRQEPSVQAAAQNAEKDSQDVLKPRLNCRPFTGPYVCHRCKKVFRLRKSLLRHLTRSCKGYSAAESKHSCSRCGMTFQNSVAHDVHVRSNTCIPAFKPLCCPVCERWFSSLEGLKRHLLSHSQGESLNCLLCGCKCSSHAALEEHKRNVHKASKDSESPTVQSAHVSQSSSSDAFRCQICQRSYPKLQSLKDHLRKVHRPKHISPAGSGSFASVDLSKGIPPPIQTKQFQCQFCPRIFQDIQSLRSHRRRVHRPLGAGLHSNPFHCQICSRTYPDIRSLRNHRRRVHRILGGLGQEVQKGFSHQHQRSLFKCQICHRSYPDLGALNNHKRTEHLVIKDEPESTELNSANVEQSRSDVFHVPEPTEESQPIA